MRYMVLAMYLLSYGDRAALSIALSVLAQESGLTPVQIGWVSLIEDGRKIGSLTGLTLTFSNAPGRLAPIVAGYVVAATGRFDVARYGCAVALVLAGLVSLALLRRPIAMP